MMSYLNLCSERLFSVTQATPQGGTDVSWPKNVVSEAFKLSVMVGKGEWSFVEPLSLSRTRCSQGRTLCTWHCLNTESKPVCEIPTAGFREHADRRTFRRTERSFRLGLFQSGKERKNRRDGHRPVTDERGRKLEYFHSEISDGKEKMPLYFYDATVRDELEKWQNRRKE